MWTLDYPRGVLRVGMQVRYLGKEGVIHHLPPDVSEALPGYVRLKLQGYAYSVYAHGSTVEVWSEDVKPKTPSWAPTNYYVDTLTGTLYCHSSGHYIAVNAIKESLALPLESFKRLYREA